MIKNRSTTLTTAVMTSTSDENTDCWVFLEYCVANIGIQSNLPIKRGSQFSKMSFSPVQPTTSVSCILTAKYLPQTKTHFKRTDSTIVSWMLYQPSIHQADGHNFLFSLALAYNVHIPRLTKVWSCSLLLTKAPPGLSAVAAERSWSGSDDNTATATNGKLQLTKRVIDMQHPMDIRLKLLHQRYKINHDQDVSCTMIIEIGDRPYMDELPLSLSAIERSAAES